MKPSEDFSEDDSTEVVLKIRIPRSSTASSVSSDTSSVTPVTPMEERQRFKESVNLIGALKPGKREEEVNLHHNVSKVPAYYDPQWYVSKVHMDTKVSPSSFSTTMFVYPEDQEPSVSSTNYYSVSDDSGTEDVFSSHRRKSRAGAKSKKSGILVSQSKAGGVISEVNHNVESYDPGGSAAVDLRKARDSKRGDSNLGVININISRRLSAEDIDQNHNDEKTNTVIEVEQLKGTTARCDNAPSHQGKTELDLASETKKDGDKQGNGNLTDGQIESGFQAWKESLGYEKKAIMPAVWETDESLEDAGSMDGESTSSSESNTSSTYDRPGYMDNPASRHRIERNIAMNAPKKPLIKSHSVPAMDLGGLSKGINPDLLKRRGSSDKPKDGHVGNIRSQWERSSLASEDATIGEECTIHDYTESGNIVMKRHSVPALSDVGDFLAKNKIIENTKSKPNTSNRRGSTDLVPNLPKAGHVGSLRNKWDKNIPTKMHALARSSDLDIVPETCDTQEDTCSDDVQHTFKSTQRQISLTEKSDANDQQEEQRTVHIRRLSKDAHENEDKYSRNDNSVVKGQFRGEERFEMGGGIEINPDTLGSNELEFLVHLESESSTCSDMD